MWYNDTIIKINKTHQNKKKGRLKWTKRVKRL